MSAALAAYLAASRLAGPLASMLLRRRQARGKEDPTRLGERLGHAGQPRPDGPLIWVHCASVGEAVSAIPLIEALLARFDGHVLMTTGTVTSARRIAGALPARALHQFVPVDTAGAVQRFLDHWRPDLGVWVESELWPRLVTDTARRGVAMAMVNARISARSAARWARAPAMARRLLGAFGTILAQDEETVARMAALNTPAEFAGNLKALVSMPPVDVAVLSAHQQVLQGRPVWLAASTHPGEEEVVLKAHAQIRAATDARLIMAPRHPERGDAIADLVAAAGCPLYRRSGGGLPRLEDEVYLADTLGEMGLWYRLAPVTFVGGSLAPQGGHTPFEPIACGSAVVHGLDVANFAPAYRALGAADGARKIADCAGLADAVTGLLMDADDRAEMVARAEQAHAALKPDAGAIADRLIALMMAA
ncbi:MAG: 3-deoxy-D-manno-octulosonic acid transferase [Pseudomonadota bacterium]